MSIGDWLLCNDGDDDGSNNDGYDYDDGHYFYYYNDYNEYVDDDDCVDDDDDDGDFNCEYDADYCDRVVVVIIMFVVKVITLTTTIKNTKIYKKFKSVSTRKPGKIEKKWHRPNLRF